MLGELLTAVLVLTLLAAAIASVLTLAAEALPAASGPLADQIDARLPQTQCGQCGFPGCRPYAQAIARGETTIDRCPPGGATTVKALARLLQRSELEFNSSQHVRQQPVVAWIDESRCTGCAICLPLCPVDAIIGAPRLAHTVLAEVCTGCELCIRPCPVDCISLRPADTCEA